MDYSKIRQACNLDLNDDEMDICITTLGYMAFWEIVGLSGAGYLMNSIRAGYRNPKFLERLGCGAFIAYAGTKVGMKVFNTFVGSFTERDIEKHPKKYPHLYERLTGKGVCGKYKWGKDEDAKNDIFEKEEETVDESKSESAESGTTEA